MKYPLNKSLGIFTSVILFIVSVHIVFAQDFPNPYQLAEPLPGSTNREIGSLEQYLTIAYISLLSASLGFALVMLVYSGVQYITAGGNQSTIGAAKSRMKRIAYGFLIIVGSVLILTTLGGDSFLKLRLNIIDTSAPQPGGSPSNGQPAGSPAN